MFPSRGGDTYIVQLLKTDRTTPLKSVWRSVVSSLGEILLLEGHSLCVVLCALPSIIIIIIIIIKFG